MFCVIISLISGLVAMAYYTLLERKLLAVIQRRKGPDSVGLLGLFQPLMDAAKLAFKEGSRPLYGNKYFFLMLPIMSLSLVLSMWGLVSYSSSVYYYVLSVLAFLTLSSVNAYCILGCGWASNSKYPLFGAVRGIAQSISYEVSLALILLSVSTLSKSPDFFLVKFFGPPLLVFSFYWIFLMWLISCLAESNRSPFDFVEGESELVSGFNTEYSAGPFAMIFMAEYMSILVLSGVSWEMFFSLGGWCWWSDFISVFGMMGLSVVFIFIRGSMPRMRYDHLMSLTWKGFLPGVLGTLVLEFSLGF